MRFDRDALAWMPAGAAFGLAFLALFSIGLLVAPIAAALLLWAFRRTDGRGAYGLIVGAGLMIAGLCLPQHDFRGLGLFGVGLTAVGVLACFATHRGHGDATRTR